MTLSTNTTIVDFVCPSCGDFTDDLNANTGFCYKCSPKICPRCGRDCKNNGHNLCIKCQRALWWERNAGRIEEFMSLGYTLRQARKLIVDENRAVCISCSESIPGRSRETTIFCSRYQRCRTAKRSYLWKIEKGVPRDLALEETIEQLREKHANV